VVAAATELPRVNAVSPHGLTASFAKYVSFFPGFAGVDAAVAQAYVKSVQGVATRRTYTPGRPQCHCPPVTFVNT
jgi:hypothetical protein